jgi:hypothetical protein
MQIRITKTRAAIAALFVLAGVGLGSLLSPLIGSALATVGQTVNISDNTASASFAKVSSDGKLAVGDGAGPLSVDGTMATRPAAPASPWRATAQIQGSGALLAGPSSLPINVTSISLSTDAATGSGALVVLQAFHVPNSATDCGAALFDSTAWLSRDLGDGVTPLSFSFPTPLQLKPPANTKACLFADAPTLDDATTINAVGFYGG